MTVTFIIPVFNAAETLSACLDSIASQQNAEWDCICIDDGSTDNSLSILGDYAKTDTRFQILRQKHGGVSSTRNLGIANATGEYVWFVDADDTIAPNSLARLRNETADIVIFNLSGGFDRTVGNLLAWNALYKRELIKDIEFPDLINHEDVVFGAETFCKAKTLKSVTGDFYRHVNNPHSAVNRYSFRRLIDAWRMIPLFWKACAPARGFRTRCSVIRKICGHIIFHIIAILPATIIHRHK